ncbi:MAG: O-antigen ligase family protein [Pseudomonadota bacterium]
MGADTPHNGRKRQQLDSDEPIDDGGPSLDADLDDETGSDEQSRRQRILRRRRKNRHRSDSSTTEQRSARRRSRRHHEGEESYGERRSTDRYSSNRKTAERTFQSDTQQAVSVFRWAFIRIATVTLCAILTVILFPITFADNATPRTIAVMTPLLPVFFVIYYLMTRSFRPPAFFLGLMIVFLGFFFRAHLRQRDFGDFTLDWAIYTQMTVLIGTAILCLFNARRLISAWPWTDSISLLLLAIIGLSALSLIGSPNPGYGAASLAMIVVLLATGAVCGLYLRSGELQTSIAMALFPLIVLSMVSYFTQTEFNYTWGMSDDYSVPRLRGIVGTPVGLSHACVMVALVIISKLATEEESRTSWSIFGAVALPIILYVAWLSESRAPPAALVVGLFVSSILYFRPFGRHSILISLVGGLFILPLGYFLIEQGVTDAFLAGFSRTGRAEEISTLTGRLEIWEVVFRLISEKPFLGHGIGSGVVILPEVFEGTDWDIVHSHNLAIHTAFSIGVLGSIAFTLLIVMVAIRAYTNRNFFAMAFIVYLSLSNITETSILSNRPNFTTIVFLFVTCRMLNLRQRSQSTQSASDVSRTSSRRKRKKRKVSRHETAAQESV